MLATDTEYIVKWKLYFIILDLGNWLLVIRDIGSLTSMACDGPIACCYE